MILMARIDKKVICKNVHFYRPVTVTFADLSLWFAQDPKASW